MSDPLDLDPTVDGGADLLMRGLRPKRARGGRSSAGDALRRSRGSWDSGKVPRSAARDDEHDAGIGACGGGLNRRRGTDPCCSGTVKLR